MNLSAKLALIFVLMVAVVTAGVSVFAYHRGRSSLFEQISRNLVSLRQEKAAALETWVEEGSKCIEAHARAPHLVEEAQALLAAEPGSPASRQARERLTGELDPWVGSARELGSLFFIEARSGRVLASTDPEQVGKFVEDRPFFLRGREGTFVQNPFYSLPTGALEMVGASPVHSREGRLLGVIAGRLNVEGMNRIIARRTGLNETDFAFLVNTSHLFVTQPRFLSDPAVLRRGVHTEAVRRALAGETGVYMGTGYRGVPVLVAYGWLPRFQVGIIVGIDQAEAFAPMLKFRKVILFLDSLVFLGSLGIALLLSRNIVKPVLALREGVERFGRGDREVRLPEDRSDELGVLGREFNRMAATLAGNESQLQKQAGDLRESSARAEGILAEIRDLNANLEQRMAELRQSERKLRLLTGNMKDVVFAYDMDRKLLYVNPAFETLTGYTVKELGEKNFINYLHSEDAPRVMRLWENVFLGKPFSDQEFRIITREGKEKWVFSTWGPFLDEAGKQIGVQGREVDITARKQAEKERELLQSQLLQAQKLESIGTLAGGVAHDINNILSIILLSVSSIELAGTGDGLLREKTRQIRESVQRGMDLVKQILAFARRDETVYGPVEVNVLLQDLVKMLGEIFPRHIGITLCLDPALPFISGGSARIHQVLMNLCVNARDAMAEGGTLTIATKEAGEEAVKKVSGLEEGRYACITVADTGSGMDEATRSRIFEPFFTTKEKGKGTGLGLAVAYGIVDSHGGAITVESHPGTGSTFRVYLPVFQGASDAMAEVQAVPSKFCGGGETVLLVEDEEMILSLARAILEAKGYRVLAATDGIKALELFKKHGKDIDLVVSDLGLPGMRGDEVLGRMKEIDPGVKALLTSGYLEEGEKATLERIGARGFLAKPFTPMELLEKIRLVLDG